ncbi:MAG TPA: helix-turn-helix transcriptional regulator [Microbacteriaceae bacterium]|nr:helix-turn-helix transcriptional regulator [Microbacteriaceae bacterium]
MRMEWSNRNLDALLLGVLRDAPAHGYEVIQRLRERSDGEFDLPEGTVYPSLHRLEKTGVLRSSWDTVAGRRRRIYEITPAGASALQTVRAAWRRYALSVEAVLGVGS